MAAKNRPLIWTLALLAIALVIFGLTQIGNGTPIYLPNELAPDDWITGKKDSKVVFLEYGDFQCPACANAEEYVKEVVKEYSNHAAFVYRHYPLMGHPYSKITAQAAEAAGLQGKFWEMHDLLYAKQEEWTDEKDIEDKLIAYAKELGLDATKFENDLNSDVVKDAVKADLKSAVKAKLGGTPTFFLNGVELKIRNYNEIGPRIRSALEAQTDQK